MQFGKSTALQFANNISSKFLHLVDSSASDVNTDSEVI